MDPFTISALAGGAGTLFQSVFGRNERQASERFNERMAESNHQREVLDLKAAGLNPILSAGGSGSPVASAGQAQTPDVGGNIQKMAAAGLAASSAQKVSADAKIAKTQSKWDADIYKHFQDNPSMKSTVMGGALAKKAGLTPAVGALLSGGNSAGSSKWLQDKMDGVGDWWNKKQSEKNERIKKSFEKKGPSRKNIMPKTWKPFYETLEWE